MRCFECGEENPSDSIFCQNCGRRLQPREEISGDSDKEAVNTAEANPENAAGENISEIPAEGAENTSETSAEGVENTLETSAEEKENTSEIPAEGEKIVDGEYRYSVFDNDNRYDICPACHLRIPRDSQFCPNCSYKIKRHKSKYLITAVSAVVLVVLLACGIIAIISSGAEKIQGTWMAQQNSMGIFGFMTESYMVIDDDSVDYYYSSFSSEEYSYKYNPITKTLTLYDDSGNRERLHLRWTDKDMFTIVENGDTFSRIADFDDSGIGGDGTEKESSI